MSIRLSPASIKLNRNYESAQHKRHAFVLFFNVAFKRFSFTSSRALSAFFGSLLGIRGQLQGDLYLSITLFRSYTFLMQLVQLCRAVSFSQDSCGYLHTIAKGFYLNFKCFVVRAKDLVTVCVAQ